MFATDCCISMNCSIFELEAITVPLEPSAFATAADTWATAAAVSCTICCCTETTSSRSCLSSRRVVPRPRASSMLRLNLARSVFLGLRSAGPGTDTVAPSSGARSNTAVALAVRVATASIRSVWRREASCAAAVSSCLRRSSLRLCSVLALSPA